MGGSSSSARLSLACLAPILSHVAAQQDCTALATEQELNLRPWFCEPPGIRSGGNDDLARCLGEGHVLNRTDPGLCRGRWQWYQVSTVHDHEVPYYEVATVDETQNNPPVVLQHVRQTRTQPNMRHALAFEMETEFCPHSPDCGEPANPAPYYTTVDVLVIDGPLLHNWNTPGGGFGNLPARSAVDLFYRGDRYDGAYRLYEGRPSVSFTVGFHMNHTRSCAPRLNDVVNIGVYCSWNPPGSADLNERQCRYRLRAHLIPEYVYDGFDATYPIAPAGELGQDDLAPRYMREETGITTQADPAAHYFKLPVGGFDVLNVSIERVGPNLTYIDASGVVGTNGHGMRGMVVRRRVSDGCPSNFEYDMGVNITDVSIAEELRAFCTDAVDAAEYYFAVIADLTFGPNDPNLPDSAQGKVGPDGTPLGYSSPSMERVAYGAYRIRVHHIAYSGGEVSHNETRGACLSYGQWRTYYIETSGIVDAALEISFTAPFSATYIRADANVSRAPALVYDVASAARDLVVTATPCDVTRPTRWHIALSLADEATAQQQGVSPAEFDIHMRLRSAAVEVGTSVTPYDHGGRGFVCCGATRYFRLDNIREAETVAATINVTHGRVRAIFAKWGFCPTFADVDELRGKCKGFCHMNWLTTRGMYSGTLYEAHQSELLVPHGHGEAPDKRRRGAWYLGVTAMPDEYAHFRLTALTRLPIYLPPSARCDRTTFACAADSARVNSWNSTGPPAPPPSLAALAYARAAATDYGFSYEYISSLIANDLIRRLMTLFGLFLVFFTISWCYRFYRARQRHIYRVPHDTVL